MKMLNTLRLIALLEGVSLLLLFGIAMPVKYLLNAPLLVEIVGMAHGVLFLIYVAFVLGLQQTCKWSIKHTFMALVASFLPFGTFYMDKILFKPTLKIQN